jgi:hypothetical protein
VRCSSQRMARSSSRTRSAGCELATVTGRSVRSSARIACPVGMSTDRGTPRARCEPDEYDLLPVPASRCGSASTGSAGVFPRARRGGRLRRTALHAGHAVGAGVALFLRAQLTAVPVAVGGRQMRGRHRQAAVTSRRPRSAAPSLSRPCDAEPSANRRVFCPRAFGRHRTAPPADAAYSAESLSSN